MVPELQCSSNDIHTHALALSLYEVFFCAKFVASTYKNTFSQQRM